MPIVRLAKIGLKKVSKWLYFIYGNVFVLLSEQ